jgi:hypothetical protein
MLRVGEKWRKHPCWIKLFVERVDGLSDLPTPVTKEVAAAILQEVIGKLRGRVS